MKKVLLVAMIALAGVSFVSCSNDDQGQEVNFDVSKKIEGNWRLSEVTDFPLPINNYSVSSDNYIIFKSDKSIATKGDFSVVINGDSSTPTTLPFVKYSSWTTTNAYENGSISTSVFVVTFGKDEEYVAYIISEKEIDLVKFAENKKVGMSYKLKKVS